MSQSDPAKALVAAMHPPSGENGMKPLTGITDPALASLGIRTIQLNNRPYLQCVTCRRVLPQPLGHGLPPGWWECPNGCNFGLPGQK